MSPPRRRTSGSAARTAPAASKAAAGPSGATRGKGKPPGTSPAGVEARRLAIEVLGRIAVEGAYANLALPPLLDRSTLTGPDRRFVTELVYGATRMRRACDAAVDPYLVRDVDPPTRAALRVGAYQLLFLHTPPHAAVSATVGAVRGPARGLVNAILRRVAERSPTFPDVATELSYPDWVVDRLAADLGTDDALAALAEMNLAATVTERDDGYIQDRASQWVAEAVDARPGMVVADLCAAPGGKATALAASGAYVVAGDARLGRCRLVAANSSRLGLGSTLAVVCADGRFPPLRPASFDRVLLDAPCSGLGALRRRPDARWRVEAAMVERLAHLQRELLAAAWELVRPGGHLVYSVCTLTAAETTEIDAWLADVAPQLVALDGPGAPWRPAGRGSLLLPQDGGTDGMYVLRLARAGDGPQQARAGDGPQQARAGDGRQQAPAGDGRQQAPAGDGPEHGTDTGT